MTSEGGQRWTESRVPLTEIKLTWRRQNADGEGKKGETFILPLSPFDPTIQKLSGFLLESDSSPQCTPAHTSQSEHLCVCLCVCKHVCVTSCVCSLATLSGALWLAVSHSWRLPSPPPATKMCSLASLHATSNRPSLHSQLRHTHTRGWHKNLIFDLWLNSCFLYSTLKDYFWGGFNGVVKQSPPARSYAASDKSLCFSLPQMWSQQPQKWHTSHIDFISTE